MNFYKLKSIKSTDVLSIVLLSVLILWRIPFLNKGIDCTDTGFSLDNYKNVFQGNGINGIGIFITTFIGGVIYNSLNSYQLLVFRIIHWILNLTTYYFSYCIFKKYLDRNFLLLLLLGMSFGAKNGEALFSYYPLTSCLLLLSVCLLIDGTIDEKNSKIFFAGFIMGINVFVRLPNLLFLSVIIIIIAYKIWCGSEIKSLAKIVGLFLIGIFSALFIDVSVMISFMGFENVTNSFLGYISLALGQVNPSVENFLEIEEKSGHSLIAEIKTIGFQVFMAIKTFSIYLFPLMLIMEIINLLFIKCKNKINSKNSMIIRLSVLLIGLFVFCTKISYSLNHIIYLLSMIIVLVYFIKIGDSSKEIRMIYGISFLLGCCSVFGSDLGLNRIGIVSTLIIPSAAVCVFQIKSTTLKKEKKYNFYHFVEVTVVVLVSAMYIIGVFVWCPKSYGDASFNELNYSVNSEISVLKGMKTTKERADQINEYYEIMLSENLQNNEVAIFGYFPLGFVIVNQQNYFENVQPCIDYPSVSVEELLNVIQEKDSNNVKPVIVVSYCNQLYRGDDHFTSEAKMAVLDYMLSLYEYDTFEYNGYFKVFIPKE